jgi:hypothetical protein
MVNVCFTLHTVQWLPRVPLGVAQKILSTEVLQCSVWMSGGRAIISPYSINWLTAPTPLILFIYHSGMSNIIDFGPRIEFLPFSQQLNHYDDRDEPKLNSLDNIQRKFSASDIINIYLVVAEMRHMAQLETKTWQERLSYPLC